MVATRRKDYHPTVQELKAKARQISGYKFFYYGIRSNKSTTPVYHGTFMTYTKPGESIVGKRFTIKGKPILCESGYHYIPKHIHPTAGLNYYPIGSGYDDDPIKIAEVYDHANEDGKESIGDKTTSNDLEIGRVLTDEEKDELLTGCVTIDKGGSSDSTLTQYWIKGIKKQDEKDGPSKIEKYGYNSMWEGLSDYYYENSRGYYNRKNGPARIVSYNNHIDFLFVCCKWIKEKTSRLVVSSKQEVIEISASMAAPYHEWKEETCGKGECWQWDHNPQRYNLGHTKPPKMMFTQTLPTDFTWEWDHDKKDWFIKDNREKPLLDNQYLYSIKFNCTEGDSYHNFCGTQHYPYTIQY